MDKEEYILANSDDNSNSHKTSECSETCKLYLCTVKWVFITFYN